MAYFSDEEIGNIIFNETRSLSGPDIRSARINIAHAIINAEVSHHRFPKMAPSTANPPEAEANTYAACQEAAEAARFMVMAGLDPTNGATHFNFPRGKSHRVFQRHKIHTSIGPLKNSNPSAQLPKGHIYANTYQ